MFEQIQSRLDKILTTIKGEGKITESNITDALRDVRRALLEADVNYQVVKSFVRDHLESRRFSKAIEESFNSARKRVVISAFFGPSIGFIAFSTSLILLWYGGREVITGQISPGELIAFILSDPRITIIPVHDLGIYGKYEKHKNSKKYKTPFVFSYRVGSH